MRKAAVMAVVVAVFILGAVPAAFATIHPIVSSFCNADASAFEHHPLGDPADPPGQTPGATPGEGHNELRALRALTDDFTDFETTQAMHASTTGSVANGTATSKLACIEP